MIAFHREKKVFLHTPRTGGVSLSEAACQLGTEATVFLYPIEIRHAHITRVRGMYPGYQPFTITRNPWDIFASLYRLFLGLAATQRVEDAIHPDEMQRAIGRGQQTFEQFVLSETSGDNQYICDVGGFSWWYGDDDTMIFPYGDNVLTNVAQYLGRPELKIERLNSCDRTFPVQWTERAIETIRHCCRGDIERFGYRSPDVR